jgi:hypothetical protein
VCALPAERLEALLGDCPLPAPEDAFGVVLTPDPDLGLCAVCVRCDDDVCQRHLDEVAMTVLRLCLVEELLHLVESECQR